MTQERRTSSVGLAFALTVAASGGTILLSLVTGVLTARFLGTEGRGHVATIQAWTLTFAWASSLGFSNSMVYFFNKHKASAGQVLSATLASVVPLGLLGVALAHAALPWGFAAQSAEAVRLAQIFLWGLVFVIGVESTWALLMAYHWFPALNAVRILQPLIYAGALVTLLLLHDFTPATVLAAQVGSYALTFVAACVGLISKVRPALPTGALIRDGMGYGLRLQGVAFGQLVTNRLDLLMLPAYVSAAELGLYSIAVNVASMVMSLFGNLAMVVFPVASRDALDGHVSDVVGRGLRLTLGGGLLTVIPLAVLAPTLIGFVYGAPFVDSVPALLWLLPGVVVWASTAILGAALQAVGRPGRASLAQMGGMLATVVGLVWLLPRYGILGAAATSTIAYSFTFLLTLIALERSSSFRLREVVAFSRFGEDVSWVLRTIQRRMQRRSGRESGDL